MFALTRIESGNVGGHRPEFRESNGFKEPMRS